MDPDPPRSPLTLPIAAVLAVPGIATAAILGTMPAGVPEASLDAGIVVLLLLVCLLLSALATMVQAALGAVHEEHVANGDEQDAEPEPAVETRVSDLLERQCWCGALAANVTAGVLWALLGLRLFSAAPLAGVIGAGIFGALFQFVLVEVLLRHLALAKGNFVMRWMRPVAFALTVPFRPLALLAAREHLKPNEVDRRLVHDRELRLLPHVRGVNTIVEEEAIELIGSVREFMELTARDVMTPRTDLEGVPKDINRTDLFPRLRESTYSRVLVYDGNLDSIVGFLLAKEVLLNQPKESLDLLRQPVPVRTDTRLPDLLLQLRRRKSYIALVQDEYGGTAGIVTLHDLFEALLGEHIQDEEEEEDLWIDQEDQDHALISGRVELWEINEELELDLDEAVARTIGGYLMHRFGRLPQAGEEWSVEGGVFRVSEVDNNRISSVYFTRDPDARELTAPAEERA